MRSKAAQTRKDLFRCTEGHLSKAGEKQVLVATRVRPARYSVWATNNRGETRLLRTHGYEIEEERPYCLDHAINVHCVRGEPVERTVRFRSTRSLDWWEH